MPNGMTILGRRVECRGVWKMSIFDQYLALYRNTIYGYSCCRVLTGNCTQAFKWYHFLWHWTAPKPVFNVTPLFDAEYLRNGTRYRHSYNGILIGTYTRYSKVSFRIALNDLEWLSEIFNDTKPRAVSLRQLSFLFWVFSSWSRLVVTANVIAYMERLVCVSTVEWNIEPS